MSRKYREYTDKQILEYVKETQSLAGLLRKLNLKPAGGNYANVKRILQKLKADTTHWTGKGWSKNQQLKEWGTYTKVSSIRPHLIALRGNQCENCKLTEWLGFPMPLEIHHKDSDRTNNALTI